MGRILQVDFVLHDICPHRRTSVGIIVTELMDDGIEASRGFKVLTLSLIHIFNEKKQACVAANCHSTGAAKYIFGTRIKLALS